MYLTFKSLARMFLASQRLYLSTRKLLLADLFLLSIATSIASAYLLAISEVDATDRGMSVLAT